MLGYSLFIQPDQATYPSRTLSGCIEALNPLGGSTVKKDIHSTSNHHQEGYKDLQYELLYTEYIPQLRYYPE